MNGSKRRTPTELPDGRSSRVTAPRHAPAVQETTQRKTFSKNCSEIGPRPVVAWAVGRLISPICRPYRSLTIGTFMVQVRRQVSERCPAACRQGRKIFAGRPSATEPVAATSLSRAPRRLCGFSDRNRPAKPSAPCLVFRGAAATTGDHDMQKPTDFCLAAQPRRSRSQASGDVSLAQNAGVLHIKNRVRRLSHKTPAPPWLVEFVATVTGGLFPVPGARPPAATPGPSADQAGATYAFCTAAVRRGCARTLALR